jgi:voltage-gated potassium channel
MVKTLLYQRMIRKFGFVFVVSTAILIGSMLLLTLAYALVEGDQDKGRNIFDWFYFTVITTRTIGFGDITPQTNIGKLLTVFNALIPASLFFGSSLVVLKSFFEWLEERYKTMNMRKLNKHYIVVADLDLLESIVPEYIAENRAFVCISNTPLAEIPGRLGEVLDETNYFFGDATRDEVLENVNVKHATGIVIATEDDRVNMYVLVTARGLNENLRTVVRVNRSETESKFRAVGADVLLPASTVIGRMLSEASVRPVLAELLVRLQTVTASPSFREVHPTSEMIAKPILEMVPRAIALSRNGEFIFDLGSSTIETGDVVLEIST